MADKSDIKEGVFFKTFVGRIGQAYAIGNRNKEEGTVNLQFEGAGCVFAGKDWLPPSGTYRVESLTIVKNKFFKVTVKDLETGKTEVLNRVDNVDKFKKKFKGQKVEIDSEKLSDEEFEETEK